MTEFFGNYSRIIVCRIRGRKGVRIDIFCLSCDRPLRELTYLTKNSLPSAVKEKVQFGGRLSSRLSRAPSALAISAGSYGGSHSVYTIPTSQNSVINRVHIRTWDVKWLKVKIDFSFYVVYVCIRCSSR